MICPGCANENPAGAAFCSQCGVALEARCGGCNGALPASARFCPSCGEAVERAESEGERRQVTILFADLVGSVALADRMDPEDWQETIAAYHADCARVVEDFGGVVTQYLGDGLLVCFGYPTAHEDDAERAAQAGLNLVARVRGMRPAALEPSADGERGDRGPMQLRVGVHTGLAVVRESAGQITIFGDTINVAARVQSEADPETVMVTDATWRLVAGRFTGKELGVRTLRGVSEAMALHTIVRPTRRASRLDVMQELTPLVGRSEELDALLEAWENARSGNGRAMIVSSEAGVGKSRLLRELRARVAKDDPLWLEGRCTSYTQSSAYRPVIDLVEAALPISGEAPAGERFAALRQVHGGLGGDPADLPILAEFLGLPGSAGFEPVRSSPEFKRIRTLDVLIDWQQRMAGSQPLVLLLEDLHWCDPSSLDFFGRLLETFASSRILLIGTTRLEFEIPWAQSEAFGTVRLERLTKQQALEVLQRIDTDGTLSPTTLDGVIARADGVPLYLEELARAVLEAEMPTAGGGSLAEIPATLHDSLMARLDRLASAREVAQRTAVLGREFSYALAAASVDLPESTLREGLARLVDVDILQTRGGEDSQTEYAFKHVLLQEAAYESLLRRTRQGLHGRVVDALLDHFPERAAAVPELVARHAEAAARREIAVAYYQRAGAQAQDRSADEEAVAHLTRAIALLEEMEAGAERDRIALSLHLALGAALTTVRGYAHPDRRTAYENAVELADRLEDTPMQGPARIGLSIFLSTSGEMERARALAESVLADAHARSDEALLVQGYCQMAMATFYLGDLALSCDHCERAIAHYDPARDHAAARVIGGDSGNAAIGLSAWQLWLSGKPDRALDRARDAVIRTQRLEDPFGIGYATGGEAVLHWMRGDPEAQSRSATHQITIGEKYGFPFWIGTGKLVRGAARAVMGDAAGLAEVMEGIAIGAQTGAKVGLPMFFAMMAQTQLAIGMANEALGTVDGGLGVAAETGQHFFDAELHRLRGELLLRGDEDERDARAEEHFDTALETARRQGARALELRAATSLSRLRAERGSQADARALLAPVYASFDEGFDTGDLREARSLLESLG